MYSLIARRSEAWPKKIIRFKHSDLIDSGARRDRRREEGVRRPEVLLVTVLGGLEVGLGGWAHRGFRGDRERERAEALGCEHVHRRALGDVRLDPGVGPEEAVVVLGEDVPSRVPEDEVGVEVGGPEGEGAPAGPLDLRGNRDPAPRRVQPQAGAGRRRV